MFSPLPHHGAPDPADSEVEDGQGWPTDSPSRKSPRALHPHVKRFFERTIFRVSPLLAIEHRTLLTPLNTDTFPSPWSPLPSATPTEWTTPVLRGPGNLTAATPEPRARKPKGTPENSPVSFSRLPAVGTSCGHVCSETAAGLFPCSPVTEQAVLSPLPHHGAPDPADS